MPNTKSVGVAFSDPELVAGTTITGAAISGGTITSAVSITASNIRTDGGLFVRSTTATAAGTDQATATQLADGLSVVAGADGTKGVKLPAASPGRTVYVKNTVAATLKIYPLTGDAINALAVNASYDIGNLTSTTLVALDSTTWYSIPLVAS